METAIEFINLSKSYALGFLGKPQRAVESVSLKVPSGSIYGFLGANGAGKTTGIKILMGLQFPSAGSVNVFGLSAGGMDARSRIGYLPERPYFHDTMTADEFLHFHRALYGPPAQGRKRPTNDELLAMVGLAADRRKLLRDFSKGMLQRIGIAQALVNDPDLVVLDEPMSGLDPVGRREVRDLILELNSRGKTIFFSSHILTDVESICHRLAFLEKGVLKFEGSLSEVHRSETGAQELMFSGVKAADLGASPLLKASVVTGEARLLRCPDSASARAAIEEIWRLGGTLLSAHREQRTLEDFLFGKRPGGTRA